MRLAICGPARRWRCRPGRVPRAVRGPARRPCRRGRRRPRPRPAARPRRSTPRAPTPARRRQLAHPRCPGCRGPRPARRRTPAPTSAGRPRAGRGRPTAWARPRPSRVPWGLEAPPPCAAGPGRRCRALGPGPPGRPRPGGSSCLTPAGANRRPAPTDRDPAARDRDRDLDLGAHRAGRRRARPLAARIHRTPNAPNHSARRHPGADRHPKTARNHPNHPARRHLADPRPRSFAAHQAHPAAARNLRIHHPAAHRPAGDRHPRTAPNPQNAPSLRNLHAAARHPGDGHLRLCGWGHHCGDRHPDGGRRPRNGSSRHCGDRHPGGGCHPRSGTACPYGRRRPCGCGAARRGGREHPSGQGGPDAHRRQAHWTPNQDRDHGTGGRRPRLGGRDCCVDRLRPSREAYWAPSPVPDGPERGENAKEAARGRPLH
jgi:hypothetical protein